MATALIRATRCRPVTTMLRSRTTPQQRQLTATNFLRRTNKSGDTLDDIEAALSQPSWSVRSLLPDPDQPPSTDITSAQLHHLLRLSALPPPTSPEAEATMLKDLQAQLHFVQQIQNVDTTGVQPLTSIRDETIEAQKARVIGLEEMREALEKEEVVGRFHRRIRRRRGAEDKDTKSKEAEDWDVLQCAERKVGRFFVVDGQDT